MRNSLLSRSAIAGFALLAGCSSSAVCSGNVGPETLSVDASSYADQADVTDVEVCIVPENGERDEEAVCSQRGTPTISYTTPKSDYPAVFTYYFSLEMGPGNWVIPEGAGGTHQMQCVATTTHIILQGAP